MTQAKKIEGKAPKAPKVNTLQKRFLSLSDHEQKAVTHFFNAHNLAHFVYDSLSDEAKSYITYCIKLSQNADKIEKENEKENSAQVL